MPYDSTPDTYKHIQQVQHLLNVVIRDLLLRSEVHDQSKLIDPEKSTFDEFTPKLKDSTYNSPEYKSFLKSMGTALEHHYFNNRHHPEYWCFDGVTMYDEHLANGQAIRRMNLIDLIEMIVDWKAATLRHANGDIVKSIEDNQKRFGYSNELKQIFLNTITWIENALNH